MESKSDADKRRIGAEIERFLCAQALGVDFVLLQNRGKLLRD